jgi:hypothetical protein
LRRTRETDDAGELAVIREDLDTRHGNEPDTWPLRFMLTAKRVRLLDAG